MDGGEYVSMAGEFNELRKVMEFLFVLYTNDFNFNSDIMRF